MFTQVCKERFRLQWDRWFCFGCERLQPKMVEIEEIDAPGDRPRSVKQGKIYMCEDFAKELYRGQNSIEDTDLNQPPFGYDDCGIYVNVGWDLSFEDDAGELMFAREDKWEPVVPSRTWSNAYQFFQED